MFGSVFHLYSDNQITFVIYISSNCASNRLLAALCWSVTVALLCPHCFFLFQVSLLEYRKRQREARRSGSKTECSSPVSTVPPLSVDAFPVGLEGGGEAPAPTTLCSSAALKEPQMNEETDTAGERGEKEEGQWYELEVCRVFALFYCFPNLKG